MRGFRNTLGLLLVMIGFSGLAFTAMVAEDPASSDATEGPSMDTWDTGLVSTGLVAAGIWLYRSSRR